MGLQKATYDIINNRDRTSNI